MAYGDLKCNNLIYETGSGDVTIAINTIPSTVGPTFTGDVTLTGDSYNVVFDASDNALEFADNAVLRLGSDADLDIVHTGATAYIKNTTGTLYIQDDSAVIIGSLTNSHSYVKGVYTGAVELFHNNVKTCETTATGINVTGTAVTDGLTVAGASDFTGQLKEAVVVSAGKLSDASNLDIEAGNVFMFTVAESTTSTPNLRYNGSTTLDSKMAVGDCLSVTIITTANASGFSAQLTIDGAAVTENWTGGSAPSACGSSGKDLYLIHISEPTRPY